MTADVESNGPFSGLRFRAEHVVIGWCYQRLMRVTYLYLWVRRAIQANCTMRLHVICGIIC